MVKMPQGFCIDSTEVTREQYQAWLDTNPPEVGQDTWCSWNGDFHADAPCMTSSYVCQGSACGKHPQVCVDWCDAYAYCKAVGKRMCGGIGTGANPFADYANPSKSQWYNACTSGGPQVYPYGATYDAQACNGTDKGLLTTAEVGTLAGCQSSQSGYTGMYDLSGNVFEWEDSCNGQTGPADQCRVRGGSCFSNSDYLRCDYSATLTRAFTVNNFGFRCCSP
jgi:formylglycine-generating enzyme required for sulfatase activity